MGADGGFAAACGTADPGMGGVTRTAPEGIGGATAAGVLQALEAHPSNDARWAAMRRLATARTGALDRLAAEVRDTGANHSAAGDTPEAGLARIAAFFDRAVAHSPEASVALYSLGDPAILAAATAEIVAWLDGLGS